MAHQVETMAYSGQVPWHGLGNRVDEYVSVDEMLVAAGLDWEVKLNPLYLEAKDENGKKVYVQSNRSALVRSSDEKVLTYASPDWVPFQNRDALGFFRDYAFEGGAKLETAGSLKGGKVIWGLANLGHEFKTKAGDAVKGYILLVSPHEVGSAISVRTTSVRVVCANTMALSLRESPAAYTHWHNSEFNREEAKAAIDLAHERMSQHQKDANILLKLKLSDDDVVRIYAKFLQPVEDEDFPKLLDSANWNNQLTGAMNSFRKAPGAIPGNAWGVIQGFNHYADHVAGRKQETRLGNAWLGENSRIKTAMNSELLKMAA